MTTSDNDTLRELLEAIVRSSLNARPSLSSAASERMAHDLAKHFGDRVIDMAKDTFNTSKRGGVLATDMYSELSCVLTDCALAMLMTGTGVLHKDEYMKLLSDRVDVHLKVHNERKQREGTI